MKDKHHLVLATLLGLALAAGLACQGGDSAADAERQAAWTELQEMKGELDAARARLDELQQRAAAEAEAEETPAEEEGAGTEAAAGAAVEETPAASGDAAAELAETERAVQEQADAFNQQLVAFINERPITEGTEPTPMQQGALDMYVDESIGIAREHIEEGGDYRQAIQIYQQTLNLDPDNEKLKAALAEAEANRYMTEERFAQVEEGMTEDEVRNLLGQVNLRNIRDYEDGERIAWFYVREQNGYAAGVFFERNDDGSYTVYSSDFDAVTPEQAQGQGQEEGE